ncbi:hypothetical protein [uncultured Maribacter sp.]|uniref:hypothetical protein n=1 Tax=uncultured Maribacter sp. TaxID=431308 RepID=UPI0030EBF228|tara:strand:+ start:23109 stop:24380 length:1272 start_codon:yes stop_codon:yes gene_type:complete
MPQLRDIEILTHCDVNRLNRAYLMAKTMPNDLIITLIIGFKDIKDKEYSLENKPKNIKVYFEHYDPKTIYPTNRFRNIAFEKSTRDYIFYLDVDFIFQHDFWTNFEKNYLEELSPEKVLCPLPLFEELIPPYLSDYKPEELVQKETQETHEVILKNDFKKTATLFKFHDRWLTYPQEEELQDITPVMRSIRNGTILPEPWGIMYRDSYLFADESFLGRVKDKQQFVCRLLDSGLEFYSMRDCVMYHLWHPDSRYDINREKENCVNTLLFNSRYLHKYQNFYFLLENETLKNSLLEVLDKFISKTPIIVLRNADSPNEVIPVLKSKQTIISNAQFYPEYSVYGYKLIFVYGTDTNEVSFQKLASNSKKSKAIFNLGYFSSIININNTEEACKNIQDLTGWLLDDEKNNRVNILSPVLSFDNLIE